MWPLQAAVAANDATIGRRFSPDRFHRDRLEVVLKAMRLRADDTYLWRLMSVLLDPAFDLAGAIALGGQYVIDNVRRPLDFSSCFPTAEHLFPILTGVTAPNAAHRGQNNAVAALPDGPTFRAEVNRLVAQIQAYENAGTNAVFRVEFAGHGFTLVLRHPVAGDDDMQIELIESLAHACAIQDCLQLPPFYVDDTCTSLLEMADDDYDTRVEGADYFEWRAAGIFLHDTGDPADDAYPISSYEHQDHAVVGEYFPRTKMKWWAHPLAAGGLQAWWALAENRLAALEQAFPGKPQRGRAPKRRKLR